MWVIVIAFKEDFNLFGCVIFLVAFDDSGLV